MSAERRPADETRAERLKAAILEGWQRLPPEDQAAVMVEQLRRTFQTEASAALTDALRAAQGEPDPLHTVFPITGVSRADLRERLRYPDETLAALDDATMREIAGRLEDAYVELEFWHHLRIVTDEVLAQKRGPSSPT